MYPSPKHLRELFQPHQPHELGEMQFCIWTVCCKSAVKGGKPWLKKSHAELTEQIATIMEYNFTFCGFAPENLHAFPEVRLLIYYLTSMAKNKSDSLGWAAIWNLVWKSHS